jgi:hypothetical protein
LVYPGCARSIRVGPARIGVSKSHDDAADPRTFAHPADPGSRAAVAAEPGSDAADPDAGTAPTDADRLATPID